MYLKILSIKTQFLIRKHTVSDQRVFVGESISFEIHIFSESSQLSIAIIYSIPPTRSKIFRHFSCKPEVILTLGIADTE